VANGDKGDNGKTQKRGGILFPKEVAKDR